MKTNFNKTLSAFRKFTVVLVGLGLAATIQPSFADEPAHVLWADDLISHIQPENNDYASNPTFINWAGVNGATKYENRSQCSTFLTHLLKQAYGWDNADFKAWLGSTSPSASLYHDAIASENGFAMTTNVQNIVVGDVIAIKYPAGMSSTGHVMLVRGMPDEITAIAPIMPNTRQYTVEVYDSSQSGHGADDTRKMADDTWDTGVGAGVFRLYADAMTGEIVGYTWSTYSNSTYYNQSERHLVVGRLY
ncbi:MAG: hypothetical protein Q7U57_16250 [Methylovulum sp.]|nr:hypothetical protein [Methylovulum sp.]